MKLLAAHIAAFAVCVAAPAPLGRESSAYAESASDGAAVYEAPLACNQIYGVGPHYPIGETPAQPVAITCVDPLPDFNIVPAPEIAPGEPDLAPKDAVARAEMAIEQILAFRELPRYIDASEAAASPRPRVDEPDNWLMGVCGVLSIVLGSLRFKEGRKRHRPGARKSRVEMRMMA